METRSGWDEPNGCTTPRGWLFEGGVAVANYLDYGPDHYRSPHEYCNGECHCPESQPGSIHVVVYREGSPRRSSYFQTIEEAKAYCQPNWTNAPECNFCHKAEGTVPGLLGDAGEPDAKVVYLCGDCAYWNDGNVLSLIEEEVAA